MTREELEQEDDFAVGGASEDVTTGKDVELEDDGFELDFGDDETDEVVEEHVEETKTTETPEVEEEEEESETDDEEYEEEVEEETEIFSDIVNLMLERGVLEIDPEKEYEDSEEGLAEIIEDTVSLREQQRLERLSPEARRLLEIEEKGGDIREAFEELYSFDYKELDMTDDSVKETLVREHLLAQGYEEGEELDDIIEGFKDLNKLDRHAEIAQRHFVNIQEAEREDYVASLDAQRQERLQQEEETIREVMHTIDTVEQLGVFSNISKQEREAFKAYLFEKDENGQTQAQKENSLETILTNEFNKFKKFKYDLVEKRAKTKATIDWRKKAQRITDTVQEARGSGNRRYQRPSDGNSFELGEID